MYINSHTCIYLCNVFSFNLLQLILYRNPDKNTNHVWCSIRKRALISVFLCCGMQAPRVRSRFNGIRDRCGAACGKTPLSGCAIVAAMLYTSPLGRPLPLLVH